MQGTNFEHFDIDELEHFDIDELEHFDIDELSDAPALKIEGSALFYC